jgi:hypothetical protein
MSARAQEGGEMKNFERTTGEARPAGRRLGRAVKIVAGAAVLLAVAHFALPDAPVRVDHPPKANWPSR